MKELRDLTDLMIHDVQPISDEQTTGRRHSLELPKVNTCVSKLTLSAKVDFVVPASSKHDCRKLTLHCQILNPSGVTFNLQEFGLVTGIPAPIEFS